MYVDSHLGEQMRTFCGHLADHHMADRPDGPNAAHIRRLGAAEELTGEQIKELRGRAAAQMALYGHVLYEQDKRTDHRSLLLPMLLGGSDQVERLRELDEVLPESASPELAPTRAAAALLTLLEPYDVPG